MCLGQLPSSSPARGHSHYSASSRQGSRKFTIRTSLRTISKAMGVFVSKLFVRSGRGHTCASSWRREGADSKNAHPIYTYVIQHDSAQILVDPGMSDSFSKDWKNNFYKEAMVYDPGPDGLFTQPLPQINIKPADFTDLLVTHLHTDHAGNVPMFAKGDTRILVHEDELRGCVTEKGG